MTSEKFEIQQYIKDMMVEDARTNFALRSFMFKGAKFNYRSDPKNSAELWQCGSCMSGYIESQSHILYCEAYADLRIGKNINNDKDLVSYMKNVLIVREKLNLNK